MASTARRRRDDMIEQFCAITGADTTVACSLLDACDGNLEMAINMHMESTEVEAVRSNASVPPAALSAGVEEEDNVRPPIPPVQEVLVSPGQEVFTFGFRGKRRAVRSVFDGFRDFQVEARRQEELLGVGEEASSSVPSRKRKTLEDLFRPPLDLIFKGSFQTARDKGVALNKWLLVNVQNVQEFACQVLNRDVWSNPAVRNIIQDHFIFWQVYMDSSEGQRYMAFYKVTDWPYVAILDPQTGERMRAWQRLDAISFCDLAAQFLSEHPSLDGAAASSVGKPVPRLQSVQEVKAAATSILDASEDSQLEAAIQESLRQNEAFRGEKKRGREEEEEEKEHDGSELETFEESEDEEKGKEEGKDKEGPSQKNIEEKSWRDFLGCESDPTCTLMLRFPNSCREQLRLPSTSKIIAVAKFAEEKGFPSDEFELVTNFPRRQLSTLSDSTTLKDAGLGPQETVFVQPR